MPESPEPRWVQLAARLEEEQRERQHDPRMLVSDMWRAAEKALAEAIVALRESPDA